MCSIPIPWPQKHPNSWDGLILQGKVLLIPPSERAKILQTIHGHSGINKCQNRARHCVYWPGINSDIKCLIESCPTCQHHCPQEPQQPVQATLAMECPCQLLSADYFHFDGSEYLVVMDYYSKMPIVRRIPSSQCNASNTISVLKELFTEHGILEVLHTDNGPSLPMHSSLSLQQMGSLTITPVKLEILEAMVKLKQPSRLSMDCSLMPSVLVNTNI